MSNVDSKIDQPLEQARSLAQQEKYAAALECLAGMPDAQDNVEALYVAAVCQRRLGHCDHALATLQRLLSLHAHHARAWQERGQCYLALKDLNSAQQCFAQAVDINPALLGSWRTLVALYGKNGLHELRLAAQEQVRQLEHLAPELQAVKGFLHENRINEADRLCRQYLQANKQDVEAMRLLADIAAQSRILDDAEFILESAVAFEPQHIGARFDYAAVLLKRQKFGKAEELARALHKEHPDNRQFKALYGATVLGVGDTANAIRIFSELATEQHSLQHTLLSLGHARKTAGDLSGAIEAYQDLYRFKPEYGDAFWSLANTKTYQFEPAELEHMLDYSSRESTEPADKVHFHFALGKAYEDNKQFEKAFEHYSAGNELNSSLLDYHVPGIAKRVGRQKSVCTRALFEQRNSVGCQGADPIFVVGLPRAGSTLLEQILASHSQVDGTLELSNILSLSRRLRGRGNTSGADDGVAAEDPQYPRVLAELEDDYFRRFGEQYLEDTQVYRQGAPFFVDKMPNNFLHIGLIKMILPNAKVIDARRHPMACCFSGFKQLFAEGQEFTYGLEEIGEYYRHYVEIMDHWDTVLPGFVLRVQHEDVVADLETQVRRLLAFCNLDFEQACVDFHQTERNVRTPSSEQVRQPIYNTGLEQWRNFEPWLEPLKQALGEKVLERYPI